MKIHVHCTHKRTKSWSGENTGILDAAATQCSGALKKEFSTSSRTLESTSESKVSSTHTLKHSQVLWKHKHVMLKHRFQRNTLEALQPHFRFTEKITYYSTMDGSIASLLWSTEEIYGRRTTVIWRECSCNASGDLSASAAFTVTYNRPFSFASFHLLHFCSIYITLIFVSDWLTHNTFHTLFHVSDQRIY